MNNNFFKHVSNAALTILLVVAFSRAGFAQTAKPHFIIHTSATQDIPNYEYALKDFDFDSYRFYDKRRIIKFTNSDATIELYSAKELLDIYGKPVSPFTLMDNKPKKEIEFYFFPSEGKVKIHELN